MYLPLSFIFFAVHFPVLANPMAQPPTAPSRGISIPLTKRNGSSPFGPVEIADEIERIVAKIQRSISIYRNNTGTDHPLSDIIKTTDKRDSNGGSLPLTDYHGLSWKGKVIIGEAKPGTPNQVLELIIDLGSTDLTVCSVLRKTGCEGSTLYDPSKSETAVAVQPPMDTFAIKYGDSFDHNWVTGKVYIDQVTVAAGLTVESQPISAAEDLSQTFLQNTDGIMGLAFPSLSKYKAQSAIHKLATQNRMNPEFGLVLRPRSYSVLCIGFLDESLYQGDITWIRVLDGDYWWTFVDGIYVDEALVSGRIPVMFDSGAALLYGDATTIKEIYLYIVGSKPVDNAYHMPCKPDHTISFVMGGKRLDIPPTVFAKPVAPDSDICYGGAAHSTMFSHEFLILGTVFLQNYFTAYQYENPETGGPRIGLARLRVGT